jgi:hypothetical protein
MIYFMVIKRGNGSICEVVFFFLIKEKIGLEQNLILAEF